MLANQQHTCCFTGHHRLPIDRLDGILKRLGDEVDALMGQGVTDFISGGALGFDQIAAALILSKKEKGCNVRLILALPCHNQEDCWAEEQKELYRYLLAGADEIVYVSETHTEGCIKKRNCYMVDRSAYCICACQRFLGGVSQTVGYAQQKGLKVVNVA